MSLSLKQRFVGNVNNGGVGDIKITSPLTADLCGSRAIERGMVICGNGL